MTAQSLVNARQQQYVNIDPVLGGILATKGEDPPEFVKRDKLAGQIIDKMQPWYRVEAEGKDTLLKYVNIFSFLHPDLSLIKSTPYLHIRTCANKEKVNCSLYL